MYMYMLCLCACLCIYGQSDRCWIAIVIDFNAKAQSHDMGRGGRSVTGVHGSVVGVLNKSVTGVLEK